MEIEGGSDFLSIKAESGKMMRYDYVNGEDPTRESFSKRKNILLTSNLSSATPKSQTHTLKKVKGPPDQLIRAYSPGFVDCRTPNEAESIDENPEVERRTALDLLRTNNYLSPKQKFTKIMKNSETTLIDGQIAINKIQSNRSLVSDSRQLRNNLKRNSGVTKHQINQPLYTSPDRMNFVEKTNLLKKNPELRKYSVNDSHTDATVKYFKFEESQGKQQEKKEAFFNSGSKVHPKVYVRTQAKQLKDFKLEIPSKGVSKENSSLKHSSKQIGEKNSIQDSTNRSSQGYFEVPEDLKYNPQITLEDFEVLKPKSNQLTYLPSDPSYRVDADSQCNLIIKKTNMNAKGKNHQFPNLTSS